MRRLPAITLPHVQHLPVTPTVAHGSPEWWDELRDSPSVYGVPDDREAWLASIAIPEIQARARTVAAIIRKLGARRVASYGVGGAAMEHPLSTMLPDVDLIVTDNAPRAVARLARIFTEASVVTHDLARDEPLPADLHILSRVEAEFTDRDLEEIIARFHEPVLLIPGELITAKKDLRAAEFQWQDTAGVFTGYRRTERRLRELWHQTHHARRVSGLGWLLARRTHAPLPQRTRQKLALFTHRQPRPSTSR